MNEQRRNEKVDQLASCQIAVVIPCYNEETAIAKVVKDFRAALPTADIYVYDNNSSDRTTEVARAAGAVVRRETHQGKGNVVKRMFTDVEADIYVLVDGDATYDAPSVRGMIARLLDERLDMVVGVRISQEQTAYRRGHRTGNWLLTAFVANVFGHAFNDILSGYRVFSRRFVKSFPVLSGGFEIETELTVHALELGLPVGEVETPYYARPEGSASKLNTWRDGLRIMRTIGQALPLGTAAPVLHRCRSVSRHRLDRILHPDLRHLFSRGDRAAAADRHIGDRADGAGLSLVRVRSHSGYGDARPARGETFRLSGASRAGRGAAPRLSGVESVRELVRTNDAVLVSAIEALLDGAGIPHVVLDQNMSVLEGSLGILPRRVLVAEQHARVARRLLQDAGLGHELRPDAG